ncbi:MAG: aminotransferase class I/II-fold pyridoxal phosphate-dependent enzyme [candidate division Zixibacteria bacterium]|nr:aminotransferase class I/II-fold pyridoxal phosphate-dependent enzyme [candidate division Zixibacteria bacterium]MDH3937219.1 aminotransferase class I/II-fold pyridoxal phosphate-dependent enzyme [candidate division Zixibacteria bacterium]MDH4034282.1 aminotransferase class I/II-fold pyridoxal phosphate-dependent enzyme [candidate division Zixibacteria bacterium]
MITTTTSNSVRLDQLTADIARKLAVDPQTILPFADYIDLLGDLLTQFGGPTSRLVAAGQVTSEVAQAADRSQIEIEERLSPSPFSSRPQSVIEGVNARSDIVYIANPNRITGATYSLSNLEEIANAVPEGALIVDEYYFDYYGVSALPLTETHSNVIVLRSFTAAFSINSADIGLVLAGRPAIEKIAQAHSGSVFTKALCRTVESVLTNEEAVVNRMAEVRQESLRIAQALDACGLFCRTTPADFLLMRVADPKSFGNALAADKIAVDNLHGYPQMKNYVRYRIESPLNNDHLIRAVQRMIPDHFRMKRPDARPTKTHHGEETIVPSPVQSRLQSVTETKASNRLEETVENE